MAEVICDTSPLQYLHQIEQLRILPALAGRIVVPPAVLSELAEGRAQGVDLPSLDDREWVMVRAPLSAPATPLVANLGPGETQVLMLALEMPGAMVVLDDALARRLATARPIPRGPTVERRLARNRPYAACRRPNTCRWGMAGGSIVRRG